MANPGPSLPPTASMHTSQPIGDLASISVSARIPEFWTDMPKYWFAQFESVMEPQKQGDSAKFHMVIGKLGRDAIQQVGDLIFSPPTENKYTTIKTRLITTFEESAETQFNKLVSEMDLGSQRPSQLLRKMSNLANNTQVSTDALKRLWVSRLPTAVKTVLAVAQDMKLDDLAVMADKIIENTQTGEIATVASSPTECNSEIITQMKNLNLELKEIRNEVNEIRGRSSYRGNSWKRDRQRSRSARQGRTPEDKNWLCWYHYRWRNRARTCEQPCNWKQTGVKTESGN